MISSELFGFYSSSPLTAPAEPFSSSSLLLFLFGSFIRFLFLLTVSLFITFRSEIYWPGVFMFITHTAQHSTAHALTLALTT